MLSEGSHEVLSLSNVNSCSEFTKSKFNILEKNDQREPLHERVFNALACGALPVTTETLYWRDNFAIGKELVCYQSGKWEKVNNTINDYLSNDTLRQSIVSLGASKVQEHHTWDSRAKQALQELPAFLI